MLLEDQACSVGSVEGGVHDGELGVGVLVGDLSGPICGAIAYGDDQIIVCLGHGARGQLLLADVGVLDDLGLYVAQSLVGPRDATGCRVQERPVAQKTNHQRHFVSLARLGRRGRLRCFGRFCDRLGDCCWLGLRRTA